MWWCQGRDREAVLVHWLNELIFLAETERWVGVEFTVSRATETELRMRARGVAVDEAPARVKAATFHGLRIAARDRRGRGRGCPGRVRMLWR